MRKGKNKLSPCNYCVACKIVAERNASTSSQDTAPCHPQDFLEHTAILVFESVCMFSSN